MPLANQRGGKKPNAGRKPGLPIRNRAKEDQGQSLVPVTSLDNIKPAQKTAALMSCRHVPWAEIARRLEVGETTLIRWRAEPWWPILIDQCQHEIAGNPEAAMRPLLSPSVGVYDKAIHGYLDDKEELKDVVPVARDVMDRSWGKPIIRTQIHSKKDITILFKEIGSDEIIEWSREPEEETGTD